MPLNFKCNKYVQLCSFNSEKQTSCTSGKYSLLLLLVLKLLLLLFLVIISSIIYFSTDNFKRVKLCDFGVALYLKDDLSAPLHDSDFYTGTQPWCSKEVLDNGPSTDKADIFAYGLLIWEMLALDVPHVGLLAGLFE